MSAAPLLAEARAAGVHLWLDGDRVRWRGTPAPDLLDRLRASKAEVAALLGVTRQQSGESAPPWDDDREWIARWRTAGPTLAEREPVLRAWLAAAPPQPLPRGLPAVELARIARNHGITVEVVRDEAG